MEFGLRWLVLAMASGGIAVFGVLMFGRGYKKRIAKLEKKLEQQSPVTINNIVGQGEKFDAEAVALELEKIYTRRQAEAIVRMYQPGGIEYEAMRKREQ